MAGRSPSRQELIRRRRLSGFVGRSSEQAAFQEALGQAPEEAQFLFHIHGPAGVGKSTLARQLEGAARKTGAITAYVDESVADPIEVMESVSAQLATQGASSKELDKTLATYRQRRHEADSGLAEAEAAGSPDSAASSAPSPSSMVASQLGLAGLGLLPGIGAFTSAVSAADVAAGADRLKAMLSTHLRNHEDVRLVLSPLQVLTPVFLQGLADAARNRPWVVLLFDTYERTGPLLDTWLRDVLVSDRYGELPANVMVLLAGQSRLDARCWGDCLDLVTNLPLEVFTEDEARHLLATKGVTDGRVVELVLKLSEGLPVLVSMLAEARPTDPAEVGDPSGTAVGRFLKWESDPDRRAAALACALPLELDEDICRAVLDNDETAGELFDWLRSLPFVRHQVGRFRYHDVVRNAMLRLQRQQSPERWREQHTRLADAFLQQRLELEAHSGSSTGNWEDERWRTARLHETYHRLCADPRAALRHALGELVSAYHHDLAALRRWVDVVARAGEDTEASTVSEAGQRLRAAFDEPDPGVAALTFLVSQSVLDPRSRALAHALRGRQHRKAERYEQAMADYDRAIELGLEGDLAHYGRGLVHRKAHQHWEALADFTRAVEADPADTDNLAERALTHLFLRQYDEAIGDYDRALAIDPDDTWVLASRGTVRYGLGHYEAALADLERALSGDPDNAWALTNRGVTYRAMGRYDKAIADFDRALAIDASYTWALINRGLVHKARGHHAEARDHYDEALHWDPGDTWALSNRALSHRLLGHFDASVADYTRLIEINPGDTSALAQRADVHRLENRYAAALADLTRALEVNGDNDFALTSRGLICRLTGRYDEAVAYLTRAVELSPGDGWAHYERAVALHALRDPGRDQALARAVEILEPKTASTGDAAAVVPVLGNLFLIHCLMPHWDEADRRLTAFLAAQPPPGQLAELLTAMDTLVDVCLGADEQLTLFRLRLAGALADAATGEPPPRLRGHLPGS